MFITISVVVSIFDIVLLLPTPLKLATQSVPPSGEIAKSEGLLSTSIVVTTVFVEVCITFSQMPLTDFRPFYCVYYRLLIRVTLVESCIVM